MRFESVTAHAFGPLQGQSLELARGMTVIHGPNESGKSTWHAALYVGLCGIRRARGSPKEDRDFKDRHYPWNGGNWEVSVVVQLADGRRVELRHDLDGKVDCRASDVDLGRDYSQEIISEGTPDGSRWLGLDRKSFLTTACVRQADIQLSNDQADALQDHLQRAAATAGTDGTAATALDRIDSFLSDFVGTERRNSTKPLRVAMDSLERAKSQLGIAQKEHSEYLRRQEELEQLQENRYVAQRSLRSAEAAQARKLSEELRRQADRAKELLEKNPREPQDPSKLRQQAQDARTALTMWENQPSIIYVSPPTSTELLGQIEGLPLMPDGDIRPHPDVVEAERVFLNARSNLETHQSRIPPQLEPLDIGGLTPQEILSLASDLSQDDPAIDPSLHERVQRAQTKLESLQQPKAQPSNDKPSSPLLRPLIILFRVIVKWLLSLFGKRKQGVDPADIARAYEELRQAEAALGDVRFQLDEVRRRKERAENTADERGLPADPESLIDLARRAEKGGEARAEMDRWQSEDQRLRELYYDSSESLKQALESRGQSTDLGLSQATEEYARECESRDTQAQQASRKAGLEQLLQEKSKQEELSADSDRQRSEAAQTVADAAHTVGVLGETIDELVEALQLWIGDAEGLIQELEKAKDEWRELQDLLNGRSVAELEEAAEVIERKAQEAERLLTSIDGVEMAVAELGEDPEKLLSQRRQAMEKAQTDFAEKHGQFAQFARDITSVSEAEEKLAEAETELNRVNTLRHTLTKTRTLLSAAQDRVHRSLAPKLRDALKPWLQDVTQGRYNDVRVDVQTLQVRVSGDERNWREANLLSHGTTEQIYLLLRTAMSWLLTKDEEACPLILDDVTVHCDPYRQRAILSLLHRISDEQQVIIFTQEPETLDWARERLLDAKDKLIELDPFDIPP